ncbi:unnamed protein product [Moneuplotes crassus]|uniref:Uncharacterized protein n=1 Tax=Euplotes crassus TaxID=5936 RepID=A0AAD2D677_EUPCR|nr:unnamed protein product [Moneuplotes crassus]
MFDLGMASWIKRKLGKSEKSDINRDSLIQRITGLKLEELKISNLEMKNTNQMIFMKQSLDDSRNQKLPDLPVLQVDLKIGAELCQEAISKVRPRGRASSVARPTLTSIPKPQYHESMRTAMIFPL